MILSYVPQVLGSLFLADPIEECDFSASQGNFWDVIDLWNCDVIFYE